MNGEYEDKFPQARAMYLYMMAHPGKKLNFMGNEFGQLREWDESREQDWDILKYPLHDAFHCYMIELNRIGQENDAFWHDYDPENFKWLDCHSGRTLYLCDQKKREKIRTLSRYSTSQTKNRKITNWIPKKKENSV